MEHLEKKGIVDTYAGVYVKNEFRKLSKDISERTDSKSMVTVFALWQMDFAAESC